MLLTKLKLEEYVSTEYPVLKTCPFCGKDAKVFTTNPDDRFITYIVCCTGCKASSDFMHTPLLAAVKWNHRQ